MTSGHGSWKDRIMQDSCFGVSLRKSMFMGLAFVLALNLFGITFWLIFGHSTLFKVFETLIYVAGIAIIAYGYFVVVRDMSLNYNRAFVLAYLAYTLFAAVFGVLHSLLARVDMLKTTCDGLLPQNPNNYDYNGQPLPQDPLSKTDEERCIQATDVYTVITSIFVSISFILNLAFLRLAFSYYHTSKTNFESSESEEPKVDLGQILSSQPHAGNPRMSQIAFDPYY